jgi:ribose 5-phosphate isomerase A
MGGKHARHPDLSGSGRLVSVTGAGRVGNAEELKAVAGRAALAEVRSGMTLGLGTGSTVRHFLEALAEALDSGELRDVRGVPTSLDTEERCRTLGIPTAELSEAAPLDLAVDGADEVTPQLDLIKGLGGALLREKIVAQAARKFVVIADGSKEVSQLGTRAPLPVEVAPFGWGVQLPFFRSLGASPVPRAAKDGALFTTDNGNLVVDLRFAHGIADPQELDAVLRQRSGVVEHGLFLGMAQRAYIARSEEVVVLSPKER